MIKGGSEKSTLFVCFQPLTRKVVAKLRFDQKGEFSALLPPKGTGAARKVMAIAWCAFTFIQCSDHYGLESGTWNGEPPKATYKGEAKVNGHSPGKRFRLPYASGIVGNDKAFIKPATGSNRLEPRHR